MNQVREYTYREFEGVRGAHYFECISFLMPDDMKFSRDKRERGFYKFLLCIRNYLYGILYAKIKL